MNQSRIDIILVRHGQTKNNTEGRFCGRADYPLTEEGMDFIRSMVAKYPHRVPERIYCSPSTRCIQTANLSFPSAGIEPEIMEDLQEIFFGEYEERLASDTFDQPELYEGVTKQLPEFAFPGGETFGEVRIRGARAFREVIARAARENSKCVAIVTHTYLMTQALLALLKEDQIESNPLFGPTGMAPNGMGIALYVEAGESDLERPLNYVGYLPVGAPLPDMSNNPYFRKDAE